jgi:hypothetical protein
MPEHLALKLGRATEVPSRADSDEHRDVDQCFRDARSLPSHRGDDGLRVHHSPSLYLARNM